MAEKIEKDTSEHILQGVFTVKKVKYDVSLTSTDLSWKRSEGKKDDGTTIPVMDIVAINTEASKSSKTGTIDSWVLIYAQRKKKNHLKRTAVKFCGDQANCQEWTNKIQQLLDNLEQRPKKILVFINPISGWSRGEKEYRSKVAPLFEEAKIWTDVKVTQRAHHPEQILDTYDLTSIDSVVSLGGDGIYSEVVNGLFKRVVKDFNINMNDPNFDLPCLDIPIGVIPCGTGNGVADANYGCKDVETAALSIIIGKRNNANIDAVHCAGEFVVFSALLVGYGLWGDMIYKTERRRNLGVFRYPLVMLNEFLFKSQRSTVLNIQYKALASDKTVQDEHSKEKENEVTQTNKEKPPDDAIETGASSETQERNEWITVEKEYAGPISMNIDIFGFDADGVEDSAFQTLTLLAIKPCTRMQMLQFIGRMVKKDIATPVDYVDTIRTTEYRVKVVSPSESTSETGFLERLLDMDGEVVELKHPEFSVRHFARKIWLFANVPENYLLTTMKSKK